jgi:catechol 2,3-dioxygenase-like lactoylglutathione lyase family enzyme
MIKGAHFLLYSKDPEADQAFFRDVLGFRSVDRGDGWLIFGLPPAEAALHPSNGNFVQLHAGHELAGAILYLMCDDLDALLELLKANNGRDVRTSSRRSGVQRFGWFCPAAERLAFTNQHTRRPSPSIQNDPLPGGCSLSSSSTLL